MDKKVMQTNFCLIFTFNYIANKLSSNLKDMLHIKKEISFNSLILAHVKPNNYGININKKDIMIPLLSSFLKIIYSSTFIVFVYNTDEVSCKLFVALLAYQIYKKASKDEILKEYSNNFSK